jgi:glutamine amidotransferase
MPSVCLIDYGAGNLHSAAKGLERAAPDGSWSVRASADPRDILSADRLVLPGVGAFRSCAEGIAAGPGLREALDRFVESGRPFLGICVGMQLLASRGLEHGETDGLGFIPGTVRKLETGGLTTPHMGWNDVISSGAHPLLPEDGDAYFVHSFVFEPEDAADVAATCTYGEAFPAVIDRDNVAGAQFHPEKSGAYGLQFLRKFLEWSP